MYMTNEDHRLEGVYMLPQAIEAGKAMMRLGFGSLSLECIHIWNRVGSNKSFGQTEVTE